MSVLVVGGEGRVGGMVVPALRREHDVRVVDRAPGAAQPIDVTNDASVRSVVAGHDALVYLAMGRHSPWDATGGWVERHFDVSVKGLYLTIRAAAEAGARQVVYASSLSIFSDYLERGRELERLEPDAVDGYGLTKRLGEQVCAAAAREHGISVVALRLCGPMPDDEWRTFAGRCPEATTVGTDVGSAFVASLNHDGAGFDPFIITGDHEQRFVDQTRTRSVLGWQPMMRRDEE